MRISQLQSLTDLELSIILYTVNVLEPIRPPHVEITPELLLFIKHNALIEKLNRVGSKIKPEYKSIFDNLIVKLNKTWMDEVNENTKETEYENTQQLQFNFSNV